MLRERMAAGFLAGAFPDSDFVLRVFDTLTYVALHRGVTHSILLLPAWAWVVAWLLALFSRLSSRRRPWQAFYPVAALGIGIHIAGDVITSYGTMLLAPFSDHAFALPFTFIIDPWFTGILVLGLAGGWFMPRKRYPSILAFAVLGCYIGFQAMLHSQAVDVGRAYIESRGWREAEAHAFPQPLSPFNWKIVVRRGGEYDVALINLLRTEIPSPPRHGEGMKGMWGRINASYRPVSAAVWKRYPQFGEAGQEHALAREAWNQEIFARFRGFAKFPALDQVFSPGDGSICVSFLDLRFTVPSLPPSLVFAICRAGPGQPWRPGRDPGLFGRN